MIGLVFSGCLIAASETSSGLSWVAWFALLPIFITIRYASPRIALIYGALWGLCLYLVLSASGTGASAATIRSLGLLAAVPAIYAYLGARLTRQIGYAPMILAVGWMIAELALEPVIVRQGLLSGSLSNDSLMQLIGGVLGYVFVAFLIAFVNAQLLSLVENLRFSFVNLFYALSITIRSIGWILQPGGTCHTFVFLTDSPPRAPPVLLS
jgi:hypothetical protein